MRPSLSFAWCLFATLAFAPAAEIDDSSYESLFKTAYQIEMQNQDNLHFPAQLRQDKLVLAWLLAPMGHKI